MCLLLPKCSGDVVSYQCRTKTESKCSDWFTWQLSHMY